MGTYQFRVASPFIPVVFFLGGGSFDISFSLRLGLFSSFENFVHNIFLCIFSSFLVKSIIKKNPFLLSSYDGRRLTGYLTPLEFNRSFAPIFSWYDLLREAEKSFFEFESDRGYVAKGSLWTMQNFPHVYFVTGLKVRYIRNFSFCILPHRANWLTVNWF